VRSLDVQCHQCRHRVIVKVDHLSGYLTVPSFGKAARKKAKRARSKRIAAWVSKKAQMRQLRRTEVNADECSFCFEPSTPDRIIVGDGLTHICEVCASEVASIIAEQKAAAGSNGGLSSPASAA
jgi:DNA-directed RNA polymerase subunit RPC12/RpoP